MKIYEKIRSLVEAQFPKAIVKEERDNTPPTFCINSFRNSKRLSTSPHKQKYLF